MLRYTIYAALVGGLAAGLSGLGRHTAADELSVQPADRPEELVAQLGDPNFHVREAASGRLIELGSAVHAALLRGENSPDPEIRFRCRRILAVIEYESREQLYAAFLRDGTAGESLGGWDRFRRVLDDGKDARRLFVEMHRSEWDLLESIADDPKLAREKFEQRCDYLRQASQTFRQQLPLGSVVSVIFLASEQDLQLGDVAGSLVYTFCYQDSFREAIDASPHKAHLRTLLGGWIANNTSLATAYQGLMLAMRHDLKEGLGAARKVLDSPAMPQHYKQFALLAVAKLGTEADLPQLEKFLDDTAICGAMTVAKGNERVILQTQLRDVALAAVIHLSGQEVKPFGFPHVQSNTQMLFNVNTLGFEDDEQRAAARKNWEEFKTRRAKNARQDEKVQAADEPDENADAP